MNSLGSHEFIKDRFKRALEREHLTLNEAFKALDSHERGFLSAYDLQDLIAENRRSCLPSELSQEVDLLVNLYDRKSG